jgi:hypothetical protein
MDSKSIEARRSELVERLNECIDEKVLRGGTELALRKAEAAYELAHIAPPVPQPWPALAAYRLAHLLMRKDAIDIDTLRRADRLFNEASHCDALGPVPLIYRISALSRLKGAPMSADERSEAEHQLDQIFDKAIQGIHRMAFPSMRDQLNKTDLQGHAFNLLELASYLLGHPYRKLEGSAGFDYFDPTKTSKWRIVGHDVKHIDMTEEFARCEFATRATNSERCLVIELNEHDAKWSVSPCAPQDLIDANHEQAKLLLLSVLSPKLPKADFERQVVGDDGADPAARYRQTKKRAIDAVRELLSNPQLEVFHENALNREIPLIGLVHQSALR